MICRQHGGMHPHFQALIGIFGDSKQLNLIAEFFGKRDVFGLDLADAFNKNLLRRDKRTKCQICQNGNFMSSINAFNVKCRIRFCKAEFLGGCKYLLKRNSLNFRIRDCKTFAPKCGKLESL